MTVQTARLAAATPNRRATGSPPSRLGLRRADRAVRARPVRHPADPRLPDERVAVAAARRRPGDQLPRQLLERRGQPLLRGLGPVHAEVHGARDDPAHRARPRARAAGAGVLALEGVPAHRRSWCPARSVSPRRRCCSTSCTRRSPARSRRFMDRMGWIVPRHAERGAGVDPVPHRLAVRRVLHAAHAGGPAGDPQRDLRGGPDGRREPLAARSGDITIPLLTPDARADHDPVRHRAPCWRSSSSTS